MLIYNKKHFLFIFLSILVVFLYNCSSTSKRLGSVDLVVSDTGELTIYELRKAAVNLAESIANYFKIHPSEEGVFVALLPTKNDTSEEIPTDVFDNILVNELLKKGIYTIRVEDRRKALQEIEFSMTGLTENPLSIGKMKSPNFFIKIDIDENMFIHKKRKIVEQIINIELREVTTQIVKWSDRIIYRKKAISNNNLGW